MFARTARATSNPPLCISPYSNPEAPRTPLELHGDGSPLLKLCRQFSRSLWFDLTVLILRVTANVT